MYRTIYNDRINEISTWILEKIINTIKNNENEKIHIDKPIHNWIFSPKNIDIDTYE